MTTEAARVVGAYWDRFLAIEPLFATMVGDSRFDHALPDPGEDGRAERYRVHAGLLASADGIDVSSPSPEERRTLGLAVATARRELSSLAHNMDRLWAVGHMPIGHRYGPGLLLGAVAFQQPHRTASQRAAYLRRLAAFPAYLEALAANASDGLATGVVASQAVVARTTGQIERLLTTPVPDSPALAPLTSGTDEERSRGVRKARAEGVDVIAETCPHYLVLTKYDHDKVGSLGKVNPPLRDEESQRLLWEGLRDGSVTCLGSDHSTVVPRQEKIGGSIWEAIPGFPGMGMLLPIMLSEGYHKGRISLEQLTRILCQNNAETYGIYPRKGCIAVGSDADFTLVDLEQERVVTPEYMQSAADWGLYDGWNLKGWPTHTIVRGEVVMERGEIVGSPAHGQYIARPPID